MHIRRPRPSLNTGRAPPPSETVVLAGQVGLDDDQVRAWSAGTWSRASPAASAAWWTTTLAAHAPEYAGAVRNLIAVPLTAGEHSMGLLLGLNKIDGEFDSVDLKLIESVANQAAVFLANNRLYDDLQDLLMGVLHALTASIDAKDPYTCGHSQRVALISRKLAELCGFDAGAGRSRSTWRACCTTSARSACRRACCASRAG